MHSFKNLMILFNILLIVSVTTAALAKLNRVDTSASLEARAKSLCRICASEVETCRKVSLPNSRRDMSLTNKGGKHNPGRSAHDCWVTQCQENPKMCGDCEYVVPLTLWGVFLY